MFESFYKLDPTPFRLTPDPHFFFESETHKRGLAYLRFAFYQREGFVVITGAPGTGKTELTLNLLEDLPQQKVVSARIVSTNLEADDLLDLVAASFNIDIERTSKGSELKKLEDFFIRQARIGKQVILIIDEAHNLSVKSLLELSMLENFQLNEKPIMQCFLVGQLSLESKLDLPELEPLKQRVVASTRLENMDQQETRKYIIHRLSKSGWKNNPLIDDEAYFFIYHYTQGIPRKINSLCSRLLLHTFVESQHKIDADTVHEVVEEIHKEAVGESLDFDFADVQTIIERASDSQRGQNKQENFRKENKPQLTTVPNNFNKKPKNENTIDSDAEVPAFLRQTQAKSVNSHLSVLEKIREPESNDSQWGETAVVAENRIQSRQTMNTAHGVVNASAKQRTTQQIASRTSGLLDKDLKFLASLAESTALETETPELEPEIEQVPETEETTLSAAAEITEKETAPIRKVIIDESLYADEEVEGSDMRKVIIDESAYDDYEPVEANFEKQWLESRSTLPAKNNGRQTAMAAIAVATLIISIGWMYLGDSEPENIVAQSQSANSSTKETLTETEVFASAAPVDIELPSVGAQVAGVETTAEANNATNKADTSIQTVSAAETLPVEDKSDTSNPSAPGDLDKQITQILEQDSPRPDELMNLADNKPVAITGSNTLKNNDSKNDSQSKLATLSTDNHIASPEPVASKSAASALKGNKSTAIKPDTSPVADSKVSTSKVEKSKSQAIQKDQAGSPLAESQIESPINKSTVSSGTSISMLNTRRNSISQQPESPISKADLSTLLFRLSDAYQTGNLQQLVDTFAADINNSEGSNRQQMVKEYQQLFNITDRRRLAIQDVKWSTKDRQMLGEGNFEVLIREKGATKYTTYQGKINFSVAKEGNGVVIKKLDYDYGE